MLSLHAMHQPDAVRAVGLTKRYELGKLSGFRSTLNRALGRFAPVQPHMHSALNGIDLTIQRGMTVGFVGANGAGKSTLLQLITGTTVPTAGELYVTGRVMPLLTVAATFHPDLTGRENVLLFAVSVGVPRRTVISQMEDVIDFAGVRDYIDTPVKRYSTGMNSRLAVAIGLQFPADIYIFDEVLAVVDHGFQDRCLEAIAALQARGATVLFVSHHLSQVRAVCQQIVWLEHGTVRTVGPTDQILPAFVAERDAAEHTSNVRSAARSVVQPR